MKGSESYTVMAATTTRTRLQLLTRFVTFLTLFECLSYWSKGSRGHGRRLRGIKRNEIVKHVMVQMSRWN